jgi:hypothetical protein
MTTPRRETRGRTCIPPACSGGRAPVLTPDSKGVAVHAGRRRSARPGSWPSWAGACSRTDAVRRSGRYPLRRRPRAARQETRDPGEGTRDHRQPHRLRLPVRAALDQLGLLWVASAAGPRAGSEYAGTVVGIGKDVTSYAVGDQVFGFVDGRPGAPMPSSWPSPSTAGRAGARGMGPGRRGAGHGGGALCPCLPPRDRPGPR